MRLIFRIASFLATLMAFVMVVVDGTTIISARAFEYTSLGELVGRFLAAGALERQLARIATNLHPLIARVVDIVVFAPPAAINLSVLALVFWMIGRTAPPPAILGADRI